MHTKQKQPGKANVQDFVLNKGTFQIPLKHAAPDAGVWWWCGVRTGVGVWNRVFTTQARFGGIFDVEQSPVALTFQSTTSTSVSPV